jgi:hypothetical protein
MKLPLLTTLAACALLSACASVPLAPKEKDVAAKTFTKPQNDKANLYIFRNCFVGQALKKSVFIDNQVIGESANKVYFFKQLAPGTHKISTESEFGNNDLEISLAGGQQYFVEQYIKMGAFKGGANLRVVSDSEGRKAIADCNLAQ